MCFYIGHYFPGTGIAMTMQYSTHILFLPIQQARTEAFFKIGGRSAQCLLSLAETNMLMPINN